jgi:Tfp pilus assembly protein PilX
MERTSFIVRHTLRENTIRLLKHYLFVMINNKENAMKRNQDGFSAVEAILVLVIVSLIGVVGFMVYNNHHKTVNATNSSDSKAAKTPTKATTPTVEQIASYEDCTKGKNTTTDNKAYPPTCTTSDGVVYRPTDPSNFPQGQQQINIPNNPYVTTDTKVSEQGGYCYNNEVPGPQATATLSKTAGTYALVRVSPNCGDSFELAYNKVNSNWTVINTSHLGLCFHSEDNTNASLKDAISKLCN